VSQPPVFAPGPDIGAVNTRRLNRQRLFEAIRRLGPISRADLAKRTRLSPPTVSAVVEELVGGAGLLREIGIGASSGGRPPMLLEFNAEFGCLMGVDFGSRAVRFAVSDLQGRILARHEAVTRVESLDQTVHQIVEGIDATVRGSGRDPRKLLAIGIGAPGATDVTTGRVISAFGLPGWTDVPVGDLVQSRFRAPVQVDNVANMAARGERWQGVAGEAADFVFVVIGDDIGAGVVIGGRVHHGHHWFAGEIGRMMLDYRVWASDQGPGGYLGSRIHPEGGAAMDELAVFLGSAVANIVTVLDPGLVVLGGSVPTGNPRFLERVRTVVSSIVPNVPALEISALGEDAQLLGAVYSAMEVAETRLLAIAGSLGGLTEPVKRRSNRK
jgi:predicted NBD/HSP70 family sugar kinase